MFDTPAGRRFVNYKQGIAAVHWYQGRINTAICCKGQTIRATYTDDEIIYIVETWHVILHFLSVSTSTCDTFHWYHLIYQQ